MSDIVDRLRFDAARCEVLYSKGIATNIAEAAAEIERLRAALEMVAGLRQCADNLMSNVEIAREALGANQQRRENP